MLVCALYEATFRVAHDRANAELTCSRDLRLEMCCNGHCDMIWATENDVDHLADLIGLIVGFQNIYLINEMLLLITNDILRTH